jgi:hypothetical protein
MGGDRNRAHRGTEEPWTWGQEPRSHGDRNPGHGDRNRGHMGTGTAVTWGQEPSGLRPSSQILTILSNKKEIPSPAGEGISF